MRGHRAGESSTPGVRLQGQTGVFLNRAGQLRALQRVQPGQLRCDVGHTFDHAARELGAEQAQVGRRLLVDPVVVVFGERVAGQRRREQLLEGGQLVGGEAGAQLVALGYELSSTPA